MALGGTYSVALGRTYSVALGRTYSVALGGTYSVGSMSGVKPDKLVMALDDTILQITRTSLSSKAFLIGEKGSASFSHSNTSLSALYRSLIF